MDRIDKESRSRVMAAIKRRDTQIERDLRSALWAAGVRGYRIDSAKVAGRPDIVFAKARVAVFVDGCFWHCCPVCYREPKSNTEYWRAKILQNVARDRAVDDSLQADGWLVVRFWEHEIERDVGACVDEVTAAVSRH